MIFTKNNFLNYNLFRILFAYVLLELLSLFILIYLQRVLLYNAFATKEFCAAGYDVLDVYPITDSYPDGTGNEKFPHDPVHYEQHVMKPVEQLLERVFSPKQ